jgi:two-component system cell cycle response regulator
MGARILLVEDTAHNLELMTYLLEAHQHLVIAVETGERGVELARQARPDLIVMDLQLPGMDGYQTLAALRSTPALAAIPVVAVTSFAMADDRDRALSAGFDNYLTKPIDPETFTEQITIHLPRHLHGTIPVPAVDEPPDATGATGTTARTATTAGRRNGADILVLDDSRINQTLLRSMLEPHGYRVRTAFTVEEAIAAAEHTRPDLVLSDVHVGRQTGTDLLSHVRSVPILAMVPFAFITATTDWQDPLLGAGATRVIHRPIGPADLLREVETLINTRGH